MDRYDLGLTLIFVGIIGMIIGSVAFLTLTGKTIDEDSSFYYEKAYGYLTADSWINQESWGQTYNYGQSKLLKLKPGDSDSAYILMKFDTSAALGPVDNVSIEFYVRGWSDGEVSVTCYPVLADWDEGSLEGSGDNVVTRGVTWVENKYDNSWERGHSDDIFAEFSLYGKNHPNSNVERYNEFPVNLDVVNRWINNPASNLGVICKGSLVEGYNQTYFNIMSKESNFKPRLTLLYLRDGTAPVEEVVEEGVLTRAEEKPLMLDSIKELDIKTYLLYFLAFIAAAGLIVLGVYGYKRLPQLKMVVAKMKGRKEPKPLVSNKEDQPKTSVNAVNEAYEKFRPSLDPFIAKAKETGMPREKIMDSLVTNGWPLEVVEYFIK